jgi:hypothetical protein
LKVGTAQCKTIDIQENTMAGKQFLQNTKMQQSEVTAPAIAVRKFADLTR